MTPTDEQKAFIEEEAAVFLQACPGAGKTFAIVGRVARIQHSLPLRQGVALLSFTNRAVDELQRRAGQMGVSESLSHPGYIGTFDSFVRKFLFTPFEKAHGRVSLDVCDSWASFGAKVRLQNPTTPVARIGISLDAFDSVSGEVNWKVVDGMQLTDLRQNLASYKARAASYRAQLHRAGHFSAADARAMALQRIRDGESSPVLGRLLAARFPEVIVDEAQDCNPQELEVLEWLRRSGIRVTMVCDLDQSIFEFRDGSRASIEAVCAQYPQEKRLRLTGNFRSTPAICSCAATLKQGGDVDEALGRHREVVHPVVVMTYTGVAPTSQLGERFAEYALRNGLRQEELMVLAHSERVARLAAGGQEPKDGASKVELWAKAVGGFWSAGHGASRAAALTGMTRLLLSISGQILDGESVFAAMRRLGSVQRTLRRQAYECVTRMPRVCADTDAARRAWVDKAREVYEKLALPLPQNQTVAQALKYPPGSEWSRHLATTSAALPCSTIHNAKGGEYGGVMVVVSPNTSRVKYADELFDAWEQGLEAEAKRVIYVGVTRAERLLVLAIPQALRGRCEARLAACAVPFIVH